MKRHEWTFEFSASTIAEAAGKKAEYHAKRAAYWRSQLTVAEAQLHEQDAETDSAFDPNAMSVMTSNYGSIRDKAQARVVDVRGKMREHGMKVHEFRMWQELLDGLTRGLELNRDDVEYFDLLAVVEPEG